MYDFMEMGFMDDSPPANHLSGSYLPEAADCMRCGLCVGGCPTYQLFQSQAETPRSRMRTLSKILLENQAISENERLHLDNCLQCRACEPVCPSKMAYGTLFDQAQAQLAKKTNRLAKLALALVANKAWRTRLLPGLALLVKSGLVTVLRHSGLLQALHLNEAAALLRMPALKPLAAHYPSTRKKCGQVALFTGCVNEHFDRDTLQAAITLLNAIGYDVLIPSAQGCCGAIHQHNGFGAATLIDNNIAVFNALDVDAVVHCATGCGAMLSEYQTDNTEASKLFKERLHDIHEFLLAHWPEDLQLQALPEKIAVHEPCSQRNVLKNQQAVYGLLAKIPAASLTALPDNALCCGAGGSYLLTHPDNARQLRDLKQQALKTAAADWVVSGNFVCAAFLNADKGDIVHPLHILARQLPTQ